MNKLFQIRRNYDQGELNFNDLKQNPLEQFDIWFQYAVHNNVEEANAMAFASGSGKNDISVRYLLLKAYDKEGFIFFTNYESRKSVQLRSNPYGAIAFYWPKLQQQIRAEGEILELSLKESDEYFNERPQGSKIGAWASPQSKPIPSREYLEKMKDEYQKKYSNFRVPRPEFWGGYKLIPQIVEFWQGRPDRLHDRFEYRYKSNIWKKERLAP